VGANLRTIFISQNIKSKKNKNIFLETGRLKPNVLIFKLKKEVLEFKTGTVFFWCMD
jgi:hypothetical protein